jgi:hypothetical protein
LRKHGRPKTAKQKVGISSSKRAVEERRLGDRLGNSKGGREAASTAREQNMKRQGYAGSKKIRDETRITKLSRPQLGWFLRRGGNAS